MIEPRIVIYPQEDLFHYLSGIVVDALNEKDDFILICGDLFHNGQILPGTGMCNFNYLYLFSFSKVCNAG